MKRQWKLPFFSLFVVFCIALNYGGRLLAARFQLPLWLDSFGTVLCAYVAGPVCGAIVGLTGNLIYGMAHRISSIYAVISIAQGVIVGLAARRKSFDTLFGAMTVSTMVTLVAMAIAVPLNFIFYGGSTGNQWGDGVAEFLTLQGIPLLPAQIIGEFYMDFLDKLVTMVLLYAAIHLSRRLRGKEKTPDAAGIAKKAAPLLLAALLCGAAVPASAQEAAQAEPVNYSDYVQTVYSSSNGLPCGEANDIAQTNDGILWIGTYAGLYRYDGKEFRWMDGYESVRNVNCLYVDAEGRLWIGTNDNGLSICINEKIANVVDQSKGLPSNSVRAIIQSSDGYYYIGTTGSMQVLTLNNGLKRLNTLTEVTYADDVSADGQGHVAAVTSSGRLYLLKGGRILSSRQITNGHEEVYKSCCFDGQGRLLAGTTTNHIYIYDISSDYFEPVGMMICQGLKSLKALNFLENGELFITADNGIGYVDTAGDYHVINTNDFNNSIDNMQVDFQGNFWFTSSRLGLLRMSPSPFRDMYTTVGMSSRVVNTIVHWQNAYYIGTDKGLDVVDEACQRQIENDLTKKLAGVRIRCMMVDSANHLWICTYGSGLIEADPDGTEYLYNAANGGFGSRARLAKELSDGTILAGGDTGISFIRDHQVIRTIGITGGPIHSMILTATEMPDGTILAGTDGDGIAVLVDGEVTRMLTRDDGLSSEVILRTVLDPQSTGVFIVTSNGLCYMEPDGGIRKLDNFPYFNNYDIWARDENTLFVMSSAGIYVVDRNELLSGAEDIGYDLLDARRGLNSALTANSWTYNDEEGNLFLACDSGVFIINANRYKAAAPSYHMSITGLRVDGEPSVLDPDGVIRVARSAGKIEMFPEIINYTIQEPYAGFYLEGSDTEWTVLPLSSLNSIVYTNLPPGSYTLHLAVLDSDRETVLGQRVYRLEKAKEIYDYPWFINYLLAVPMVAAVWFTWLIVRTRIQHTLELQERELAVARRQIEMGNQTIIAIAKAVDAKDERTSQHSLRVSQYSVMIGQALGLSEEECENIRKTALMHDIGKIGIPDSILNKPAKLTDEEYAVMKSHTTRGAEILKDFTLIDHVVEGAHYHHERYDGRGYPNGLKGEDIPLYARIIGVADAFDAMTANRVYRKQMDFDYVLGEIRRGRGAQFDPQMADILLRLIDEGKIDLNQLYPQPQTAEGQ